MKLEKKYFGVISNGTLRKYFNYDTVQEIMDVYEKHYKGSNNNIIGIIDLETNEFMYPDEKDSSRLQERINIINNVYNNIINS